MHDDAALDPAPLRRVEPFGRVAAHELLVPAHDRRERRELPRILQASDDRVERLLRLVVLVHVHDRVAHRLVEVERRPVRGAVLEPAHDRDLGRSGLRDEVHERRQRQLVRLRHPTLRFAFHDRPAPMEGEMDPQRPTTPHAAPSLLERLMPAVMSARDLHRRHATA
jgi:hypothetical protein